MNKGCKNISKLVLISYLVGFIGLGPVFAQSNGVQLRGIIDDSLPGIQLKGGVNIDKSKQMINLNLRDTDTKQVLRMFADKAGMNIVFHDSVSGKVTLDLVNVTLNKAFEYVMTISGLTYWQDGNTLVVASKSVANGLSINKAQIKPIQIKYVDAKTVADFLNSNIFSLNRPDISVNQVAITNPRTNQVLILGNDNDIALAKKTIEILDVKPLMKTFNVNYADPSVIASNICMNVFNTQGTGGSTGTSGSSSGASGSSSGSSESGGSTTGSTGSQIICGTSGLTASTSGSSGGTSSASSVGIGSSGGGFSGITSTPQSLNINGYVVMADFDLSQVTVSGSQDQINLAEDVIKRFDKKQPQAYIEISIVELSESGSKSLQNTMYAQLGSTRTSFSGMSTTISDTSGLLRNLTEGQKRLVITEIKALVQQHKGRVLANPRIIATNGRPSTINITSQFVQTRKVETVYTAAGLPRDIITYGIGDTGIDLELTPRISPNGYVTLDLVPDYSSIKEQVTDEDNNLIATLINTRKLDLKNVRVRDGETLVLGGLIQENDSNDTKKVPLFGDIPIIGALFKASSTDRARSELILMITPKIIEEEDTVSAI